MNEGATVRELLTWFLEHDSADEAGIRAWLAAVPPTLWPGFSAEAAAELNEQDASGNPAADSNAAAARHHAAETKRRLLGEERQRREYSGS
jgi:hypothetical protein